MNVGTIKRLGGQGIGQIIKLSVSQTLPVRFWWKPGLLNFGYSFVSTHVKTGVNKNGTTFVDFRHNRAGRFRDTDNFRICPIPLPPMRQNRKILHVERKSFSNQKTVPSCKNWRSKVKMKIWQSEL